MIREDSRTARRLPGSFTVEASFIMAFLMLCIVSGLQRAYLLRDRVVAGYAVHTASLDGAFLEPLWEEDRDEAALQDAAAAGLHAVSGLGGAQVTLDTGGKMSDAELSGAAQDREIWTKIRDPEDYMRMTTVVEALLGRGEDDGG